MHAGNIASSCSSNVEWLEALEQDCTKLSENKQNVDKGDSLKNLSNLAVIRRRNLQ